VRFMGPARIGIGGVAVSAIEVRTAVLALWWCFWLRRGCCFLGWGWRLAVSADAEIVGVFTERRSARVIESGAGISVEHGAAVERDVFNSPSAEHIWHHGRGVVKIVSCGDMR